MKSYKNIASFVLIISFQPLFGQIDSVESLRPININNLTRNYYEAKNFLGHFSLLLYDDGSFLTTDISLECGLIALSEEYDSVSTGVWEVINDSLILTFGDSISKTFTFLIDDYSFCSPKIIRFIKTKEFDNNGNLLWKLDLSELVNDFKRISFEKEFDYLRHRIFSFIDFLILDDSLFKISNPYTLVQFSNAELYLQEAFIVSQIDYILMNPNNSNQTEILNYAIIKLINHYNIDRKKRKNMSIEKLISIENQGKLKKHINRKL